MDESKRGAELLKELQQIIADELGEKATTRAFRPLTDGLGLSSPTKPEISATLPPLTEALRIPLVETESLPPSRPPVRPPANPVEKFFSSPPASNNQATQRVYRPPVPKMKKPLADSGRIEAAKKVFRDMPPLPAVVLPRATDQPPNAVAKSITHEVVAAPTEIDTPLERNANAGVTQRFLAFVIDQVFVWTVWLFAIIVTLKGLMGTSVPQLPTTGNFQDPLFLRFALMEFATLWMGYLAIGIGVVDMTFGMWVWGLRVRYDDATGESRWLQKALRIVTTFFFVAPVLPSVVLAFRRKGRNLLDVISGTRLYRSVV